MILKQNAIRIVLFSINSIANRHGKYIVPLVCYQSEFYLRLFFVVNTSKSECARTLMKLGHVMLDNQEYYKIIKNNRFLIVTLVAISPFFH